MSTTPSTVGSEQAPTGPSQSLGSKRGRESIDTPIEVESNQTPSNRVDDNDVVEVQSQEEDPNCKENSKLKSTYWQYFKRIKINGVYKAECLIVIGKLGVKLKMELPIYVNIFNHVL